MSKPTRGATKVAPGKRKAKVRPQPRPMEEGVSSVVSDEVVQADANATVAVREEPVLQFRPKARDAAPARTAGARAQTVRQALPTIDYGYVYTDLRIIGVVVGSLLVALIALSFVIH